MICLNALEDSGQYINRGSEESPFIPFLRSNLPPRAHGAGWVLLTCSRRRPQWREHTYSLFPDSYSPIPSILKDFSLPLEMTAP
ncbi:MAG: hypothetical protein H6634_16415 [Anaerolineales bacterium]|nr:hypothetical protein [Anaerolineales bacterium]